MLNIILLYDTQDEIDKYIGKILRALVESFENYFSVITVKKAFFLL